KYEHKRTPEEKARIEEAKQKHLEEGGKDVGEVRDTETRLVVRHTPVFHASQIDGIPPLERPELKHQIDGKPDPRIEALATEMGVEVVRGGSQAFYRPSTDRVHLPEVATFRSATGHDTTFLHELSHATGHESRMHRELGNPFGSDKYAKEELRAEMAAAMTAMTLGIGFDPQAQNIEQGREVGNTAAYLASWLKSLPEKDRKTELMAAIKDAQAISDYLIERTPEVALEKEAPVLQSAEKEKESPTLENVQQQAAHTLSPSDYDLGKEHRNTPYLHKDHENHWKISVIADDNKRHWGNAVLREKDGVQKLVSRFDLDENRSMLVNVVARDGRLESKIAIDNKEDQSRTFV
ncbi:zincin-like metallopeptidase domain-containing protein, partial [Acidithiobacillus caldus]